MASLNKLLELLNDYVTQEHLEYGHQTQLVCELRTELTPENKALDGIIKFLPTIDSID